MHRRPVLNLLATYLEHYPEDAPRAEPILELVRTRADCFDRTCLPGHLTASAWILSPDRGRALLTHHRKLGKWLQLGGHADREIHLEQVALREAREESGMASFELPLLDGRLVPLDVDVHPIPANGRDPAHWHHDVRFLLIAGPGQQLAISDESIDLAWFAPEELEQATQEESVLRIARRAALRAPKGQL